MQIEDSDGYQHSATRAQVILNLEIREPPIPFLANASRERREVPTRPGKRHRRRNDVSIIYPVGKRP